ncbi:MAG: acetyl-CoA C-acyltransferase FadI [Vicinamibacteria bacterium]|nr:acetyl-CoA C-acyltransferase FadI [Vicinamibacteria bacterium]
MPGRVALVASCRTPFAKSGEVYKDLTALDLAKVAVQGLIERSEIDPKLVGTLVMGQVVPSIKAPNLGRETGLGALLPKGVPAHTINRACASSNQAVADVASAILMGHIDVGIAGGAESLSSVPILHSKGMANALVAASKARSVGGRLGAFSRVRFKDFIPDAPAIAEPSTGLSMGQSAEQMAKDNGISRAEQDEIAFRSHQNAARARDDGRLGREIAPVHVPPKYATTVTTDGLIRADTSMEALSKLKPVFDRRFGSVTAGNSSPLTDGAAAVLLMSEDRAKSLGYTPLAYVKSWAVAAVDPAWQLLMGPALAIPLALDRAGLSLADMDLIEMHEAFGAQVASNIQALESDTFAKERLGRSARVGAVDRARLNVCGSSIAIGHPFGATGARITGTLGHEMTRRNAKFGLISVCAQGGMGFAMILER